jgi:hypothetical protein
MKEYTALCERNVREYVMVHSEVKPENTKQLAVSLFWLITTIVMVFGLYAAW